MREFFCFVVFGVIFVGCQCGSGRLRPLDDTDAGIDAGLDAGVDAGLDAGLDAGVDAGLDAGVDAGLDAGVDAGLDAGVDAGFDAGVVNCVAGDRRCVGLVSETCTAEGTAYVEDRTAVGCEFWPMIVTFDLFGYLGGNSYGLSIANDGFFAASVTIEGGTLSVPVKVNVPPRDVKVVELSDRAWLTPFHLTSTRPVTVVQFNPLYEKVGGVSTQLADASRLRPTHTWGTDHVVASWVNMGTAPGEIAIVASRATVITVTPRADIAARNGVPAMAAGVPTVVSVDAGTYLALSSIAGDLTGSHITSTAPIEVVSGHLGTRIPADIDAADKLEDAVLPTSQLSTEYYVVSPALQTIPTGKAQIVRIIAAEPQVDLSYEPPRLGAPTHLEALGDFLELDLSAAVFRIRATKKVLVAQYMQSQATGGMSGDPSLFLPPPIEQFSKRHVFYAPPDYDLNALDIVAPNGATVTLDDVALSGLQAIGSSAYSFVRKTGLGTGPQANGVHQVVCSSPCMLSVYGAGQYISYWY